MNELSQTLYDICRPTSLPPREPTTVCPTCNGTGADPMSDSGNNSLTCRTCNGERTVAAPLPPRADLADEHANCVLLAKEVSLLETELNHMRMRIAQLEEQNAGMFEVNYKLHEQSGHLESIARQAMQLLEKIPTFEKNLPKLP